MTVVVVVVVGAGPVPAAAAAGSSRAKAADYPGGRGDGGQAAAVISTVAGGVGGPAGATQVSVAACGVSYGAGRVYVGDPGAVREVNPQTDHLTTPAGTGATGPLGDGGPAAKASIRYPCATAVDHSGNLVIADRNNERVRVVAARTGTFYGQAMTGGDIYTVAGGGTSGLGDGGPATSAELNEPWGVAVDGAGNLVIADTFNYRVRVVAARTGTFYGQAMTGGDIYTVAGDGTGGFSGDGGPATSAELNEPQGVAVDGAGNLLIADTGNYRVRVVAASTGSFYGQPMTAGDIYTVAGTGRRGFSGDGGPATSAELNNPQGVAVDGAGNLLIADSGNHRVRVVAASTGSFYGRPMTAGDIYTVAGGSTSGLGDGGPATSAELNTPQGVAVDGAGNLLIADSGNYRVRVVAARSGTFYGRPMTAGDIYTVAGNGTNGFSGKGGAATKAQLNAPASVAVDSAGNILIADTFNQRVRAVAASTGTFYGQAMTAGDIYTVAGTGRRGFSGDGGPATKAQLSLIGIQLPLPAGVAVDGAGNLLIADCRNNRIRVVAARTGTFYGQAMTAGDIYTIAGNGTAAFSGDGGPAIKAELNDPTGVAADSAGNLLIADQSNERIRVVAASTGRFYGQAMTAGDIYTVAGDGTYGFSGDGGPALGAELGLPASVTADGTGNLLIADADNRRIRVVAASTGRFYGQAMTAGDIYTVAGDGNEGFSGDGGPATKAKLGFPVDVTADGAGNLLIADASNNRIRVVAASTGTFYGHAMTAGDIYTIAGDGKQAFSGDGDPATSAGLFEPLGVAADGAGNLLIADSVNNRIRKVTG